ncbi:hypothetical protein [Sandarakinorhabdus sp. DWP1-3-1]|uniref:hypothetical protein n=1 Tax=Sandarakinorhabdus sp. DWP1-3-1 TaxID=2804627 RepID=UPI003CE921EC
MKIVVSIVLGMASAAGLSAQKSQIVASNGVTVDISGDDFANRYEYTGPVVKFSEDNSNDQMSFAFVAAIKKGEIPPKRFITGVIYYRGDWHRYASAVFKGGDPAPFVNTSRNVLSCRYGCSYTEGFNMDISADQIKKYSSDGVLQIQIRAQSSNTAIMSIPVSHFDAVAEASR